MEITITISKYDLLGILFIAATAPIIFILIVKSVQNFKEIVGWLKKK